MELSEMMAHPEGVIKALAAKPDQTDSSTWPELAAVFAVNTNDAWSWWKDICTLAWLRSTSPVTKLWLRLEQVNGSRRITTRTMKDVELMEVQLELIEQGIWGLTTIDQSGYARLLERLAWGKGMVYEDAGDYRRAVEVFAAAKNLAQKKGDAVTTVIYQYNAALAKLIDTCIKTGQMDMAQWNEFTDAARAVRFITDSTTPLGRYVSCVTHANNAIMCYLYGKNAPIAARSALKAYSFMEAGEKQHVEEMVIVLRALLEMDKLQEEWKKCREGEDPSPKEIFAILFPILNDKNADPYRKSMAELIAIDALWVTGRYEGHAVKLRELAEAPPSPGTAFARTIIQRNYQSLLSED